MDSSLYGGYIYFYLGSLVAIALFYPLLETNSLLLSSLISAFNSFFLIPLVPIILELGCELIFPVGEGTAVGLLFAMGNFAGFLLGLFLSLIVGDGDEKSRSFAGLMFCLVFFVIGYIMIFLLKEEKNREKAEEELSEKRKSKLSTISASDQSNRYSISVDDYNSLNEKDFDNSNL
jgi:hypothetical protein